MVYKGEKERKKKVKLNGNRLRKRQRNGIIKISKGYLWGSLCLDNSPPFWIILPNFLIDNCIFYI